MDATHVGFQVDTICGVPVVRVPKDMDIVNASGLRSALVQTAGHGSVVVDMAQTQFCDTAGLHALVAAHKRVRAEGGQMLLVIGGAAVLRVFAITGLDRVIPHVTSVAQ